MPQLPTRLSVYNFFNESLLILIIIFSVVLYGGVTPFALTLIESLIILAFFLFSAGLILSKDAYLVKIKILPLVFFTALVIFQILPLSKNFISFISPTTSELYHKFMFDNPPSYSLSLYKELSVGLLLEFVTLFSFFFVFANYIDTEQKRKRLVLVIVILGFLCSFFGIIKRFYDTGPGFSTFTNRNHFSGYIQMVIPLAIVYAFIKRSRLRATIFLSMATVMLLTLFISLSRAGVLCFGFSLLICLVLLRLKKKSVDNKIFAAIIFIILISAFFAFAGFEPLTERFRTLLLPFQAYEGRYNLIKDSLSILRDFPLWGVGFGALGEIFQKYKTFNVAETFSFTHNEPLQIMVEAGIFGFIFIAIFFLKTFKELISVWFKRHNPYVIYFSLGCFFGLISVMLHSLFDFTFHIPADMILFFVILALAYRVVYSKGENPDITPKMKISLNRPSKAICIIAVFLLCFITESLILRRYYAEKIFDEVKEKRVYDNGADALIEYGRLLKKIDKAISLNPLNSAYYNKKADFLSEVALREDSKNELPYFKEFKAPEKLLMEAEGFYKKAVQLNPTRADYHLRLGWLYGVMGKEELTKKAFNNAIRLDPQNFKIKDYVNDYFSLAEQHPLNYE